ncbi:hypothetical protein [Oceanicoccus sp. KOV_DT_Chl]|uniref:hypothetical protein n=1 Tax=Oceanicoccus sp. KOV_DT_Chl TaxID=1904639 RepID=UPI000C7C7BB3|nr:hypothetical protein [Oceanicoccus sp. KOV_DT_Chl]
MESAKRIIFALSYFAFIFVGTIFFYQYDKSIALLFTMVCFGALSSYLANGKRRSRIGWFFIGFFTGVMGVAMAGVIKPIEIAHE